MKKLLFILLSIGMSLSAFSQGIQQKVIDYYKAVPMEKVYLHTDKSNYIAGDSVWFRGYLINAITNRQSLLSYYIYVDLVATERGEVLSHSLIRCDSLGVFANNIALSNKLSTGTYKIVAYSSYMRNFPEEYFFSKTIGVKGFGEQEDTQQKKRKKLKSGNEFYFDAMPEGGQLIVGEMQKVAFKATDLEGGGEDVKVVLTDMQGNEIAESESQHLGMGSIAFTPYEGQSYFLTATTLDGKEQKLQFPAALQSGITITATQHAGELLIRPLYTPDIDISKYEIVIHGSLNIAVAENITRKDFRIPLSNFHEGVTLISIVEKATNQIAAERALFIRGQQKKTESDIAFQHKKNERRHLVKAHITAPKGTYSLSVTDKDATPYDSINGNIVSTLLLSSEIKGKIEQPLYYFSDVNVKVDNDLDLLMLTQAWRRYNISDILNDVKPTCKYPIEQSQAIEGSIGGMWKKNMKTPSLLVMCSNPRMLQIIELNKSGRFALEGLQFADSTKFLISALNHKGSTSFMDLNIDETDIPHYKSEPMIPLAETVGEESTSYKLRYSHLNKLWMVELPDLEVRGHKREEYVNRYGIMPNRSYSANDDELKSAVTIESLFYAFNAPMSDDGTGRETFAGVVYVNDFPYEKEYVNDIMPEDIERIEYISRHNAATMLFSDSEGGSNTATQYGVIAIKLKDPSSYAHEKTGRHAFATKVVTPLGYKQDVDFYAPRYDTPERMNDATPDIRTTVYWTPSIIIGDSGEVDIEFYTPDNMVDLQFDLQGINAEGPMSILKR
ncbi:MAG: hypothetical protein Q4F34_05700 [Prevotellaceae bacterium]|nr:hypothetical protein [Prevotellaceae bacterium]